MKISIPLLFFLLCIKIVNAQHLIKGRVLSEYDKTPIEGATLMLIDGNRMFKTNQQGQFSVRVSAGTYVLKVQHVGYVPSEIPLSVPLKDTLLIWLREELNELEAVEVNTGYQQLAKERATGSFALVSKERLSEQVSTDVLSRLENVANGFSIDRKTNGGGMMIRGLSTIQGSREPLIVLDNFPYEGSLENINPNDVESITLLKDAAAASIWGARAGNGVIVITTKRAKLAERFSLNLNANISLINKPNLHYLPTMSSSDFVDLEQFLFEKGYFNNAELPTATAALSPVVEWLIAERDGKITSDELRRELDFLRAIDSRDNYAKFFYQRGVNQQYAFNMQGGTEKMGWLLGTGLDRNVDALDARYQRVNLKLENNWQVTKKFRFDLRLNFTQSDNKSGRIDFDDFKAGSTNLPPYTRFVDEYGTPLAVMKDYRNSLLEDISKGQLLDWNYYPYTDHRYDYQKGSTRQWIANTILRYNVLSGLDAELYYQLNREDVLQQAFLEQNSYYTRNMINTYSQIDQAGNVNRPIPLGGILDRSESHLQAHNVRALLRYNRSWEKHDISWLGGAELMKSNTPENQYRSYGFNSSTLTSVNVDYANTYPTIILGQSAFIPNPAGLAESMRRTVSVFTNAAYTYLGKYTLTASARRDASNLFGVNANDKWNPLWSAGLAWNLSKENFFRTKFFEYLKLKATYGFSGNVNQAMAAITTIRYGSTSPYTRTPTAAFANYYNPELRWEQVATLNLAMDFGLYNNRIAGSIEYYRKNATDLFGSENIDYTAGIGYSIVKNAASMKAQGLDLQLNTKNIVGTFNWISDFFANYYRDEVTKYNLASRMASNFINGNLSRTGVEGRPVYSVYAYKWAGLDPQTGDPMGYVNGEVSKDYVAITGANATVDDLEYMGSAYPVWTGALGNTFSYRNFSLTVRIAGKFGHYFKKPMQLNYSSLFSTRNGHSDYAKRWQQPGDEIFTTVPSLVYPANSRRDNFYNGATVNILKGDFIRLQYINFSYTLSKETWKKLPFSACRFFINANNLGLLWRANKEGIDPDYNYLPDARTFSLGFNLSL